MLTRTVPLIATLTLTASGALLSGDPAQAANPVPATTHTVPTAYAMTAFGYGSRVHGGHVPAGSDRSAFQVIGCTNRAGLSKVNAESAVDLGAGLALSGVKTHVWTSRTTHSVSSWASHTISKVTLHDSIGSTLFLNGVSSTSHSWHNGSGFHAAATATIGSVVVKTGPVRVAYPVPTRGHDTVVPGVARISLGNGTTRHGAGSASATIDAAQLSITGTTTKAYLAHSSSTIHGGVRTSLFSGSAYDTKATALSGSTTSGPTPLIVMSCIGTNGRLQTRKIAHLHLGGAIRAQNLKVSQRAAVHHGTATADERAVVGHVTITRNLEITSVAAQANVTRAARGYHTNTRGTSTGTIRYNGRIRHIPTNGVLRIPGVAKIQAHLVHRTTRGIEITALKVSLLDGTSTVVTIAHAKASVAPSGL